MPAHLVCQLVDKMSFVKNKLPRSYNIKSLSVLTNSNEVCILKTTHHSTPPNSNQRQANQHSRLPTPSPLNSLTTIRQQRAETPWPRLTPDIDHNPQIRSCRRKHQKYKSHRRGRGWINWESRGQRGK